MSSLNNINNTLILVFMKKLKIFEKYETFDADGYYYRTLPNSIPAGLTKISKRYNDYEESSIYVDKNGKEILATFLDNDTLGLVSLISKREFKGRGTNASISKFFYDLIQDILKIAE